MLSRQKEAAAAEEEEGKLARPAVSFSRRGAVGWRSGLCWGSWCERPSIGVAPFPCAIRTSLHKAEDVLCPCDRGTGNSSPSFQHGSLQWFIPDFCRCGRPVWIVCRLIHEDRPLGGRTTTCRGDAEYVLPSKQGNFPKLWSYVLILNSASS